MKKLLLALMLCACGLMLAVTFPVQATLWKTKSNHRALPDNTVVQAFPARGFDANTLPNPANLFDPANYVDRDTVWVLEWSITNASGFGPPSSVLKINTAHFGYRDRTRNLKWITVVRNIELGEIFVPYDPGSPQFEDIESFSFKPVPADPKFLGPDCLSPGAILKSPKPGMDNVVYKEVHDDGIRLIDNTSSPDRARRGEKMALWINFFGANYRYLIEYGFSDDGCLSCRVAGTARNFNDRQPPPRLADTHLHVGCWMYEPDLGDPTNPSNGGPDKNIIRLVSRMPDSTAGRFHVEIAPFPGVTGQNVSTAGSANWVPEQFTTLRVESTVRRNGSDASFPTSYDLVTVRTGSSRFFQSGKEYANRDYWVTSANPGFTNYRDVPSYVTGSPGPIDMKPMKVWHNSPLLHVARGEDFGTDGVSASSGSAIASWAGFYLKPRNLFDSTPLMPAP